MHVREMHIKTYTLHPHMHRTGSLALLPAWWRHKQKHIDKFIYGMNNYDFHGPTFCPELKKLKINRVYCFRYVNINHPALLY